MADKVQCAGGSSDDSTEVKPAEAKGCGDKATNVDSELEELLDSAFEDFDKPLPNKSQQKDAGKVTAEAGGDGASTAIPGAEGVPNNLFAGLLGDDVADSANQQFEEAMKQLMAEDPGMMQQFEQLARAAGSVGDSPDSQKEFADSLQDTLGSLAQSAQDLQGNVSEEELLKAMGGLGLDEGAEGGAEFMPMMQGMMQTLLSKDVLYPSLKEIVDKYPKWLSENEGKLEKSQYDNYVKQSEVMSRICGVFDEEKDGDSAEQKQKRFEKILDLMQQMQECGQPPADIVGEMAPGLEFDEQGNPKLPGSAEQCSIM